MDKNYNYNEPWIEQRADPYVMKADDGTYYFSASVPEYDRVMLRSSKTLSGLKEAEERTLWVKHDDGIMSCNVWAPEIHYLFGGWYIYFAASDKDDIWALRPYVLKCTGNDPMKDDWVECGQMQCADDDGFSFRAFSLDMTVFEHKGEWYCIWAEKVGVGRQISNLYIARMESATKLSTIQILLTTPDYDWERVDFWVNEGPAVLKHDGRLFMTFSASCTGAPYCMGMLSISEDDDVLDPARWEKLRYPVCKTDASLSIYGPGHNSFTVDDEGKDVCIYHARTYEKIVGDPLYDPNRHAMIMPVKYDDKGYPVFDLSVK